MSIHHFLKAAMAAIVLATAIPASADGGESIFVKEVEGRGKDHQTALADAFQNAIRKALGTYVVTHSTTDGETLDEKIYLNSDAVVKDYKIIGREDGDGFVSLLIDAEIVRNEMMKYIHREATEKVDGGELANLLNKRKAINSAVKSLDLLFLDYQENLYRVEKYGSMSIAPDDELSSDRIMVSIPFVLTFRWDAYRVWREKLVALLDQISIAKTTGRCKDLDAFEDIYEDGGFFEKNGAGGDNPNKYRGVLFLDVFLDERRGPGIGYTLYLVPFQIDQKLRALLDFEVDFQFTFSTTGGNDIVNYSVPGKVGFFQSSEMRNFYILDHFDQGCLIFMNMLRVRAGWNYYWTPLNLFHASIPVRESDARKIGGCKIRCIPHVERESRGYSDREITRTELSRSEWSSFDPGPQGPSAATKPPTPRSSPETKPEREPDDETDGDPLPEFESIADALEVVRSDPTFENIAALENCWGALPRDLRPMLQTNVLNASCAVFLARGNMGAVAKRKARIDSAALWSAVTDECPACHGSGHYETKCFACGGSGKCSSCQGRGKLGGGKPLRGMSSEAASVTCSRCHGSGHCQSCTNGRRKNMCTKCYERGRIVSKAKCKSVFEQNVDAALRICLGE